jgi:hypothetical protein
MRFSSPKETQGRKAREKEANESGRGIDGQDKETTEKKAKKKEAKGWKLAR